MFTKGYRMPAEWEQHEATWLAWPHDLETWPREIVDLESTYVELIDYLHGGEKVHILVQDEEVEASMSGKLYQRGITKNVWLHVIETDSPWIRDYGPTFVIKKGARALIRWKFNAWGEKYKPFHHDSSASKQMAKEVNVQEFRMEMILEGGSIDVNGQGTCLTTEECLLNPNRNPTLKRVEIEKHLENFLGIKHVIWLKKGIEGDDTDGHVDQVARFVNPTTMVAAYEEDSKDPNFSRLEENVRILTQACDQDGKKLNVVTIPMPDRVEHGGTRFPASYVNFYIANQYVFVPIFGDEQDTKALGILKSLFPSRMVVGIPAIPLIYGQGAIHCMTQQEPAVVG
ncbi:MAG: agmatine deiminase family protein [Candidatus Omnitrophica bacterium]|nr:agmatine deiminase family protein [Candidatus Omnitrophota bacterium]